MKQLPPFVYVSIDIETMGLDRKGDSIVEFGAVVDDLANPKPISELKQFHAYILPPDEYGYRFVSDFGAKKFFKYMQRVENREPDKLYIEPRVLGRVFAQFLRESGVTGFERSSKLGNVPMSSQEGINLAGKNVGVFDVQFLEAQTDFFQEIVARSRVIDTASHFLMAGDSCLPSSSQCLERMGRDPFVAHTALEDARMVIEMVRHTLGPVFKWGCSKCHGHCSC